MSLRIYSTLSRAMLPLLPIEPGHVRMYVCGMTVYDLCHLGHARSMVAFDVVQRWLKASGLQVSYVRNITDIDDKIIRRAVENGETIRALTDRMIDALHQDADALGIERPGFEPRATDYVPQMLSLIGRLVDQGLAYPGSDGDVNYAVRKFPSYGRLSGKSLDDLRAGERVAVAEGKDDPLDFVLWKAAKPEEPQEAQWDSGWGLGRPGWHIECTAIALKYLAPIQSDATCIDIQGGGSDLIFPHHEMCASQAQVLTGKELAATYVHAAMIGLDGEKMSKSKGNLVFVSKLINSGTDPMVIRFALMSQHYRLDRMWTDELLIEATARVTKIRQDIASSSSAPTTPLIEEIIQRPLIQFS